MNLGMATRDELREGCGTAAMNIKREARRGVGGLSTFTGLFLFCLITHASGQTAQYRERCRSIDFKPATISLDDAITGCSAIIGSGDERGRSLAEAYLRRGIGFQRK